MAKVKIAKKVITNTPAAIPMNTQKPEVFENGLADALGFGGGPFGGGGPGFPSGAGSPEQVSDTTTLFTNLRWYLVSNFRQLLSELYVEIGLVRTFVDVPVDDALKDGVEVKTKQLDENEVKQLQMSMEYDNDLGIIGQAAKWLRLFGGAGILIIVGDQDPEEPLDLASIGPDTEVEFRAVDMWELFWDKQNTDGYDPEIQTEEFEFYDYYASKIHKSRVMKMKGLESPSFIRPRLRGWGFSIIESVVRPLNQFLKTTDVLFEVIDEFKIDVYKIKNLVNTLLSPNGTNQVKSQIQMTNWHKNYQNAIVLDSEDEWDHKELSFAGLSEVQAGNRKHLAAELRMPVTKLFGSSDSASSMGNADQNDMENYNSMVESTIRTKLKFHILQLIQIKCQKLFGHIPDDLEIKFKPLRVLSAEQEENVKNAKFTRLKAAKDTGDITIQEFRDACNKGGLIDIQLDTNLDQIDSDKDDPELEAVLSGEKQQELAGTTEEENEKEPGADGFDSRSPNATKQVKKNSGDKWDESKHPRADDGKFGAGGADGKTAQADETKKQIAKKSIIRTFEVEKPAYGGQTAKEIWKITGDGTISVKTILDGDIDSGWQKWGNFKEGADIEKVAASFEEKKTGKKPTHPKQSELDQLREEAEKADDSNNRHKAEALREKARKLEKEMQEGKKKNELLTFSEWDKLKRFVNSAAFDRASYEADGGDSWISDERAKLFENPGNVDEALWAKAKDASKKAFGQVKWKFVTWFYKKSGGKF